MGQPKLAALGLAVVSVLVAALGSGCNRPSGILITATSEEPVEQYDLYLFDHQVRRIFFHSGFQPAVDAQGGAIDTRVTPIKTALRLSRNGKFTLLMVGVNGPLDGAIPAADAIQMFYAGRIDVDGPAEVSARLLVVPTGDDRDRDLWPDATDFLAHSPEAARLYASKPQLLDCNDKIDFPRSDPSNAATEVKLEASKINPFAPEICGDGYDANCSGNDPDDEKCIDADGDGDVAGQDCDDKDPKRHNATAADPFPDPPNCCGYSLGKAGTDEATTNFAGNATLCPEVRCGNGVDNACEGSDTECVVDEDCDGYPPPPVGNDCDDEDPARHPGAFEACDAVEDMNCSGAIGEGCVPCDLDGDGYQRKDDVNQCPREPNQHPGAIDCNDNDAGVHPGATTGIGAIERGNGSLGKLGSSYRGFCRRVYGNETSGVPRVSSGEAIGDMDCNGVPFEGCPPVSCDADGDGEASVGGCGGADCNDADPRIFPSAAERCGDGVAQNCVSDSPCTNDGDGDGYNADVDCDPADPAVHPWAIERCNGKDDDCDGLVDEGNPDGLGNPMVVTGAITQCTDSNVGECGVQPGRCVCSAATEVASYNAGNRNACPGESTPPGPLQPKCFGAGQPRPQSCDATNPKDDDCDGRNDDPSGANLIIKGMPCGVDVGQCKSGTVVGCDSSQSNPFTGLSGFGSDKAWYLCSAAAVYPAPEVCDFYDNDCDGALDAPEETDVDNDLYLDCETCGGTLNPAKSGCGDCNDSVTSTHPGADELCDNVDNNCANGISDDGSGPTGGCAASLTCCSAQTSCIDLATTLDNCGGCGLKCNPVVGQGPWADACVGSACRCGAGAACAAGAGTTPGQWCNGGSCTTCNTDTHCGPNCVNCGSSHCKPNGSQCVGCNYDSDCNATQYCNASNQCVSKKNGGQVCAPSDCSPDEPSCVMCSTAGGCVDGRCCTSACDQLCERCTGGGGTCIAVGNGTDPDGECPLDPANPCERTTCNGTRGVGACNMADNTVCEAAACSGTTRTRKICLTGVCTDDNVDCSPLICQSNACRTNCQNNTHCVATHYCGLDPGTNGQCKVKKPAGGDCSPSDCEQGGCVECDTGGSAPGGCVDGYCCDAACGGACDACDNAGVEGTCSYEPNTVACGTGNVYLCPGNAATCPTACGCGGSGVACGAGNDCCAPDSTSACSTTAYCQDPNGGGDNGTCLAKKTNGATCEATPQCQTTSCCNNAGTKVCGTTNTATHCGTTCLDCSNVDNGHACYNDAGTWRCGCTVAGDCPATKPTCNGTTHLCE